MDRNFAEAERRFLDPDSKLGRPSVDSPITWRFCGRITRNQMKPNNTLNETNEKGTKDHEEN